MNLFKHALESGRQQVGLWSVLGNPVCTEICADSAFDWILIDAEHGPSDVLSVMAQLQAAAPHSAQCVVRPPDSETATIKRYLDIGAKNLLIPMIASAAHAEAVVDAFNFAPEGKRGVALTTRAGRWGRASNYLQSAREDICVILQIETIEAYNQVGEIARLPGVDAMFIGPGDLSAAMGRLGGMSHPEVTAAVKKAIKIITDAGKPAGMYGNRENAKSYFELGCSFVSVGSDAQLLVRAVDELRTQCS